MMFATYLREAKLLDVQNTLEACVRDPGQIAAISGGDILLGEMLEEMNEVMGGINELTTNDGERYIVIFLKRLICAYPQYSEGLMREWAALSRGCGQLIYGELRPE